MNQYIKHNINELINKALLCLNVTKYGVIYYNLLDQFAR